jgi:acylpyruvate hydrolase
MRLITYSFRGTTRAGALLDDNTVVDLNRALAAHLRSQGRAAPEAMAAALLPPDMVRLLERGDEGLDQARQALDIAKASTASDRSAAREAGIIFETGEPGFRLEAPVPNPGTVLAVGLNYQAHVNESRASDAPPPEPPKHPTVFSKTRTAITAPGAPIRVPKASVMVDWEGELCFVIGKRAHQVPRDKAFDYIAGHTIGNDVSVRDWQFHAPTWVMGKGFATHAPIGPWLVTKDEAPDVTNLRLQTRVNGDLKQDASTGDLIFNIPVLVEYLTTAFVLEPGDIVFTGTPSGVGAAMKPPQWLKDGDVVAISITGLGVLENPVVAES